MAQNPVSVIELQESLRHSQERLASERRAIALTLPLTEKIDPKAYISTYSYAERLCLKKIRHHLDDLSWLPIQLDPEAEMRTRSPVLMNRWAADTPMVQPSSFDFGNDFVHALTRAGLMFGWDDIRTARLSARIANLFSELGYLVAIVYYVSYLAEARIESVQLDDPKDLKRSAREFAALIKKHTPKIISPATEQFFEKPDLNKDKHAFLHLVVDQTDPPPASP